MFKQHVTLTLGLMVSLTMHQPTHQHLPSLVGSVSGCDSIVTLDLTINNFVTGTDVQTACNTFTWIDGITYNASTNTPTFTIVGGSAQQDVIPS
jgi:hypothetical protein